MTDERSRRFSLAGAAVALVTVGVGTAAGLAVVPVVGSYLGMLLGGFVAGFTVEDRPTVESGIVAALAAMGVLSSGAVLGGGVVDGVSALVSVAPTALLTSAVLSFAVGAFGAHFGDDLRKGLTSSVEAPPSGTTTAGPTPVLSGEEETARRATAEDRSTGRNPEEETARSATAEDRSTGRNPEEVAVEDLELERE